MRIAVVGCGYWGAKHVRVFSAQPGVDEVIAVDSNAQVAALDATGRSVRVVTDLEAAIDAVDAVVVATPPSTHVAIATAAIRRGRPVLIEKPISHSVVEASRLVAEAAAERVVLMSGHTFEFHPAIHELRRVVRAGHLGDIRFIDSVRLNLGPVRRDVDVIGDLATHDISIANFVLDSVPDRVHAWADAFTHPTVADTATLRLDYDASQTTVSIRVSWLDPVKIRRTTFVGTEAMAVFDDLDQTARVRIHDCGVEDPGDGSPVRERVGPVLCPDLAGDEPLQAEAAAFLEAVRTGIAPECDGRRGLDVLRIVVAAQEAAATGQAVAIDWTAPLHLTLDPAPLAASQAVA